MIAWPTQGWLMSASQTFTTRLYEQASAAANQPQAGGDDEVVDAEVL